MGKNVRLREAAREKRNERTIRKKGVRERSEIEVTGSYGQRNGSERKQ